MQIGRDLQKNVKARIDKNQREYILREQLKLIREELGEDNTADDAEEFKKKLQELQAGDEVKEKISKEKSRCFDAADPRLRGCTPLRTPKRKSEVSAAKRTQYYCPFLTPPSLPPP